MKFASARSAAIVLLRLVQRMRGWLSGRILAATAQHKDAADHNDDNDDADDNMA